MTKREYIKGAINRSPTGCPPIAVEVDAETFVHIYVNGGTYCVHYLYTNRSVAEKEYYEKSPLGLQTLLDDIFEYPESLYE